MRHLSIHRAGIVPAILAGVLGAAGLVACTGGGSTPQTPPPSATASAGPSSSTPSTPSTSRAVGSSGADGSATSTPPGNPPEFSRPPGGDRMPTWNGPKRSLPMSTAEIETGRPTTRPPQPAQVQVRPPGTTTPGPPG